MRTPRELHGVYNYDDWAIEELRAAASSTQWSEDTGSDDDFSAIEHDEAAEELNRRLTITPTFLLDFLKSLTDEQAYDLISWLDSTNDALDKIVEYKGGQMKRTRNQELREAATLKEWCDTFVGTTITRNGKTSKVIKYAVMRNSAYITFLLENGEQCVRMASRRFIRREPNYGRWLMREDALASVNGARIPGMVNCGDKLPPPRLR